MIEEERKLLEEPTPAPGQRELKGLSAFWEDYTPREISGSGYARVSDAVVYGNRTHDDESMVIGESTEPAWMQVQMAEFNRDALRKLYGQVVSGDALHEQVKELAADGAGRAAIGVCSCREIVYAGDRYVLNVRGAPRHPDCFRFDELQRELRADQRRADD